MRLSLKFDRRESIAVAGAVGLVALGFVAAGGALSSLSEAVAETQERATLVAQLETALRRGGGAPGGGGRDGTAPDQAFLAAPTAGQATALLQAHVTRLVAGQRAMLAFSAAPPSGKSEADEAIRLQIVFDMRSPALQALLYALETGVPYVFVDGLSLQPQGESRGADQPVLHVTLNLRGLWKRTSI
jgi:hypothetical protein